MGLFNFYFLIFSAFRKHINGCWGIHLREDNK